MKASESKWPWRPVHITNDGKEIGKIYRRRGSFENLTGIGIISNEHLQGIQTSICVRLRNPTTILEFTINGKPVRTDSILMYSATPPFGMPPTCKMFRESMGAQHCFKCNNRYALLLSNLNRSDFPKEVEKRIQADGYIQEFHRVNPKLTIKLRENDNRWLLEYDCPLMGCREVLFPVFFENKVVAVFFVGQICLKKKLDLMKQVQEKFFKAHEVKKGIVGKISKTHNKWVSNNKNVLSDYRYTRLIDNTCYELDGLEGTLIE